MSTTHPDDIDTFGPRLWDATPGVCCAAFQLGACAHTEGHDWEYEELVGSVTRPDGVRIDTWRYTDGETFTVEVHPAPEATDLPPDFPAGDEPF